MYELRSQETFSMIAAQQVFLAQAEQVRSLFEMQALELCSEYKSVYSLVKQYEKKIKQLCYQISDQECIISKLTTQLSYSLNQRYNNQRLDREILAENPILDDDKLYYESFPE